MEVNEKQMYENFTQGQVQAFSNVLMTMEYGCSPQEVFATIQHDNMVLGGFIEDLWKQAKKEDANENSLITYLSTENGGLIDMAKVFELFLAFQYASKNKLVEMREELLPEELKEYIAKVNESKK